MHRFIVIEGNIGAGKTALAKRIAEEYMGKLILERFSENPFLSRFYDNPKEHGFSVELSFLANRYNQLKDTLNSPGLFSNFTIADYYFVKSLIFARVNLDDDEFKLFRQLFDIMNNTLPKPDLYVYINSDTARLQQNINKRGRDYEKNISDDYLHKINDSYMAFFKQANFPILVLTLENDTDFVNQNLHYEKVKSYIFKQKFTPGIHFLKLNA